MTENQDHNQKKWVDEAEEALSRTGEALRSAWDQTRDTRMQALETAKEAATRLGEVIDQGIAAARQSWEPSDLEPDTSAETGSARAEASASEEEE